jgi:cation diffusion facilitator family transporter
LSHAHNHALPPSGNRERYLAARRVTVVGALVNVVLSVLKVVLGLVGQSAALIADGVHSLTDLITDGLVLYASKHGSRDADDEHPYGHARVETLATVGVGLLLVAVACGIAYDATRRLFDPATLLHPGMLALAAAAISVISKELLTQYTLRVAKRYRSQLLRANAWHHRSDAISSVVVIVGILGTMAGLDYLDAVAAVVVALMIGKVGVELIWSSVRELSDEGLEQERIKEIKAKIRDVEGVEELHMLRTRRMGANALVDVHILVNPRVSVSEGHLIGENVRRSLIGEVDEVTDVTIHIDPEDDEIAPVATDRPTREEMEQQLRDIWQASGYADRIERLTLHYLDGEIHIEACLPLGLVDSIEGARALSAQLAALAESIESIGRADIYFQ